MLIIMQSTVDTIKKLIQQIADQGLVKNMRWTRQQQKDAINQRKNPHTIKTRDESPKQ